MNTLDYSGQRQMSSVELICLNGSGTPNIEQKLVSDKVWVGHTPNYIVAVCFLLSENVN